MTGAGAGVGPGSPGLARPGTGERVVALLMRVSGVLVGGAIGAILWLIVMQEGPERGWTDYDYNEMAGQMVVPRQEDVAKAGLWTTLLLGIVLACLYPLVFRPLRRRLNRWVVALLYALVPFLLWGLLMAPAVTAYEDTASDQARRLIPGGAFGVDGGDATPVLAAVASILFALCVMRAYSLMTRRDWWTRKYRRGGLDAAVLADVVAEPGMASLEVAAPEHTDLLEFPEEVGEEGREGPLR